MEQLPTAADLTRIASELNEDGQRAYVCSLDINNRKRMELRLLYKEALLLSNEMFIRKLLILTLQSRLLKLQGGAKSTKKTTN